ncbi:tetratricopeptide repeat-containing protein [Streptomyces sp. PTD9-10]|uniref:tetratricopeptide repeat-containing protein n=1 Tax=Streptomyces sp. PTD9-10 TaxID=3120151 RepID=UPI003009D3FB
MSDQTAAPEDLAGTDTQDPAHHGADAEGTFLAVVFDSYQDPAFRPLPGAVEQVDELAAAMDRFGYRGTILKNPGQGSLVDALNQWSDTWSERGGNGPAVVAWSGHAEIDNVRDLQLVTHATRRGLGNRDRFYSPENLASQALTSRADQVLILLDTCHSGAGALPALDHALSAWEDRSLPEPRTAWIGVLAACQAHEKAAGARGLLLEMVLRLLKDGPYRSTGTHGQERRGGRYRHEWSVRNEGITGETLALAVLEDWPDSGQLPVRASAGRPAPIFRNPLWLPESVEREALVEHLVLAARGIDPTEEGWFFTGRRRALREITDWLATGAAGMFLLTGSAGVGKSAVAGRIAALSDPSERAALMAHAPLTEDDPDPGERSVDAAVHLRGMGVQDLAHALAYRLGLPEPKTPADLIAHVERSKTPPGRCHVLVLDGLDEASPGQAASIAEQLLVPLSRLCTVLLASRDRPFQPHQEPGDPLEAALTRTVRILDLDQDHDTTVDITDYVRHRLRADGIAEQTADDIAPVLAERAGTAGGGFLFARIVASHLARTLADDPDRPWRDLVPAGITDALARDLATAHTRVRDGHELPDAATDLLTALAWAAGNGMPAHGVWQTAAQAVGNRDTAYGPEDIDWLLQHYGRYIVEDSDGHQAVYRLYHRELISYLRGAAGVGHADAVALAIVRALVGLSLGQTANGASPELANLYLRRHLPDHALAAGGPGVTALRPLVEANRDAYLPGLAGALNNLAIRLSEVGRRQEALAPAEEAVGIYRALAESNSETYLPYLASALNTLANRLSEVGRRQEALAPAEEAAGTYRVLAEAEPAAYRPDLAGALNTLANRMSEVGRRQEALALAEEAAGINRVLAGANPDAYLPDLAGVLNNLAIGLSQVGRRQEALALAEEAVRLRRVLAEANPDAYLADLAGALNNLAIGLSEVGRRQEALAPAEESAGIYRVLAEAVPDVYLPDLAGALSTLAIRLSEVGRRQEALAPAEESVRLRRVLAEINQEANLPDLAMAVNNLANRLSEVGRRQEALALAEEAVRLRRVLAETIPDAYLPDLAGALNNLAIRLSEVGRRQEALAPAEEAVGIYRVLAEAIPDAYLPDLTSALNTLAVGLSEVGRRQEALVLAEEAAGICRVLAESNSEAYLPYLANVLNTLANRLSEVGWRQEALAPVEEAVGIYRVLAEANSDAYLPDLAGALNNLAIRLSEVGRRQEVLAPVEEAVGIYRVLAEANSDAYLPYLANVLNNLAVGSWEVGRRQEALALAEEAAGISRVLAEANPDPHLPDLVIALNNLANRLSETGRLQDALQRYEEIIAEWSGPPQAATELAYHRALFLLRNGETGDGTEALCGLLAPDIVTNDEMVFRIHQSLRDAAASDPEVRESVARLYADRSVVFESPSWLELTEQALRLTADWLNTRTWAESRDFVTTHPALLDADSRAAMREWSLLGGPADFHIEMLEQLLSGVPVDTVYRPLVLPEILTAWIRTTTDDEGWSASAAYLADHAADLLAPDADAALAVMGENLEGADQVVAVHRAIAAMAAVDGIDDAYRLLEDRQALHTRVQKALAAADGPALGWLALIEDGVYDDPWAAAVHWLAAQALDDSPDADGRSGAPIAAVRAAVQVTDSAPAHVLSAAAHVKSPDADERNRAVAELAALMAARPTRAAPLGEILQAVVAPPLRAPEE